MIIRDKMELVNYLTVDFQIQCAKIAKLQTCFDSSFTQWFFFSSHVILYICEHFEADKRTINRDTKKPEDLQKPYWRNVESYD